jgi:hypothetical protein
MVERDTYEKVYEEMVRRAADLILLRTVKYKLLQQGCEIKLVRIAVDE